METLGLTLGIAVIQLLGLPGLVFVIWHFDNKKFAKMSALHRSEIAQKDKAITDILSQYRADVSEIKRLYENNVHLVKEYEKAQKRLEALYSQTIDVISLNTQTQTQLVDSIRSNQFCPATRRM